MTVTVSSPHSTEYAPRLWSLAQTAALDVLWVLALVGLVYLDHLLPAALLTVGVVVLMTQRARRYHTARAALEAAHAALSASEARYRQLLDLAPDAIWMVRLRDQRIVQSNRAARDLYGYGAAEFLQLTLADLRPAATRDLLPAHLAAAQQGHAAFETQHLSRSGRVFPVAVSANQIPVDGEPMLLGIIRDITPQKQLEADLQAHLSELRDLAALSTALRAAPDQVGLAELLVVHTSGLLHLPRTALVRPEGDRLAVSACHGECWVAPKWLEESSPLTAGLTTPQPQFLTPADLPELTQMGLAALWTAPLPSRTAPVGLLLLGCPAAYQPNASDQRLLTAIAEMAGIALQRMQMTATLEDMIVARSRELECIYQVAAAANGAPDLAAALQEALAVTLTAVDAPAGGIFLLPDAEDGSLEDAEVELVAQIGLPEAIYPFLADQAAENSMARWIIQNRRGRLTAPPPAAADDPTPEARLTFAGLPICVGARIIGVLGLGKPDANDFSLDEMTMLSFVADHLGLVVENSRRNHQLARHAILAERSRLARELHDSVTQQLYSAALYTAGAQEFAAQGRLAEVPSYLAEIGRVTQQALKEMRLLVYALRSPALQEGGLLGALRSRLDTVERRSGIEASLEAEALPLLPPAVEEGLYRIAIEALNNSLKHAAATQVCLELQTEGEQWLLRVADNGRGCDLTAALTNGGVGLSSIRERAAELGGRAAFHSASQGGTEVVVTFPAPLPAVRAEGVTYGGENPHLDC